MKRAQKDFGRDFSIAGFHPITSDANGTARDVEIDRMMVEWVVEASTAHALPLAWAVGLRRRAGRAWVVVSSLRMHTIEVGTWNCWLTLSPIFLLMLLIHSSPYTPSAWFDRGNE